MMSDTVRKEREAAICHLWTPSLNAPYSGLLHPNPSVPSNLMMHLPHPHCLKGKVRGYIRSLLSQPHPLATPPARPSLSSQIIQDRILGVSAHPSLLWNSPPGALLALPTFSTSPLDFPFYHLQQGRPWGWDNLKSPQQLSPSLSQPEP